jgi:hypothetical protein
MPSFIVERRIEGAATLTRQALLEIGRRSKQAASGMDVPYSGVETYVDGDMVCCIHQAENADVLAARADAAGFPADRIVAVAATSCPAGGVLNQLNEEFGIRAGTHCSPAA